jgi:hypothetical protein
MHFVIEAVRRHGVVDGMLYVAARAVHRLTRGRALLTKYYFMAQPVPAASRRVPGKGIVIERVHEGDPRLALFERPAEELARRFGGGATCLAAWHGEALAGFLWFTERPYDEDEVRCTFRVDPRDRAVWDLDVHVVPRFRLGRTFALLWEAAFDEMRARGIRWTISRVSAFNADSMRAHQRLGARRTGSALFFLWGSLHVMLPSLGRLKCRRLEQRPFPLLDIRAPADWPQARDVRERDAESVVAAGSAPRRGNAVH